MPDMGDAQNLAARGLISPTQMQALQPQMQAPATAAPGMEAQRMYQAEVGKLFNGQPDEREAYVSKYGYDHSLDLLNREMMGAKSTYRSAETPDDQAAARNYHDSLMQYRDSLLARQGS